MTMSCAFITVNDRGKSNKGNVCMSVEEAEERIVQLLQARFVDLLTMLR